MCLKGDPFLLHQITSITIATTAVVAITHRVTTIGITVLRTEGEPGVALGVAFCGGLGKGLDEGLGEGLDEGLDEGDRVPPLVISTSSAI